MIEKSEELVAKIKFDHKEIMTLIIRISLYNSSRKPVCEIIKN